MNTSSISDLKAELIEIAKDKLVYWGLWEKGWRFQWNHKSKRAIGLCSGKKKLIYLSTYYLDVLPKLKLIDTILHEIAHAIDCEIRGDSYHDSVWKKIAITVGAKPVATTDVKEYSKGDAYQLYLKKHRYKLVCPNCGRCSYRHRKPKTAISCGDCNPKFYDERFRMILKLNV